MRDERIREVVAETLDRRLGDDPNHPQDADEVLAALRDAGFDVVPVAYEGAEIWYCDDCMLGGKFRSDIPCPHSDELPTFRLVPVEEANDV